MNLTLFSDASLCAKTGAAGWGAWAKRDDWSRGAFVGGPLRCVLRSSTAAELAGIACALYRFRDALPEVVMIQCDSTTALGLIRHVVPGAIVTHSRDNADVKSLPIMSDRAVKRLSDTERDALAFIVELVKRRRVALRHVKGHREGDGRNWVNTHCDSEARRHMQSMRRELKYQRSQGATQPQEGTTV